MSDRNAALEAHELDVKDRADRALYAGNASEALTLYSSLLRNVSIIDASVYDGWLEGMAAAYQRLGRTREAGYVFLYLRRFGDAERCFTPAHDPHEWALCAANQGRPREASRALTSAGHTAMAAMMLETAGDWAGARSVWEMVLREDRLRARPYEAALVHFNLGQALRRLGATEAAQRELTVTQIHLEELADDFETRGDRERAFDCYAVLIRLGKETGSFENVA